MNLDLLMSRIRQQAIAETHEHALNAQAPCECGARPGENHDPLCKTFYRARMAREQELHQELIETCARRKRG